MSRRSQVQIRICCCRAHDALLQCVTLHTVLLLPMRFMDQRSEEVLSPFIKPMLRTVAGFVYGPLRSPQLPILMYHRVLPQKDPFLPDTPDARLVATQLRAVADVFQVLPLEEAVERLHEGTLPARAVCITFDDGYRNNHDVALPILKSLGLSATLFLATQFVDGGCMFNDTVIECLRRWPTGHLDASWLGLGLLPVQDVASRLQASNALVKLLKNLPLESREAHTTRLLEMLKAAVPTDLMLTSDHVRAMARQGVAIGGHTHRHPNMSLTSDEDVQQELAQNRAQIQSLVGYVPQGFAYPFGKPHADYNSANVDLVREAGFRYAVSTSWGVAMPHGQRYQLPRLGPTEATPTSMVMRLLKMTRHYRAQVV
jgi:peptidoglycan/xylan/chitin deacetylase (PgdA/CDA1 family)